MRMPWFPIALLLVAPVLAGCSATTAPPAGPSAAPQPTDAGSAGTHTGTDTDTVSFPTVSSCDQLASIVGDYVGDIPLNTEQSYLDAEDVLCTWNREDADVAALEEIQAFEVGIIASDDEVLTMDDVAAVGMDDVYFTDSRLEQHGGIGMWLDMDTSVAGTAAGSVLLPGIEVRFTDLRWGADNLLDRDTMVDLAMQIIAG